MDELTHALLSALPLPAMAIDASGRIAATNAQVEELVGKGSVGRNFVTILRQPSLIETIEAVLSDGQPRMSRYLAKDGVRDTTYTVTARVAGEADLLLLCFIDITDEEHAGQMRRDFVANVSHELRTPLTALMGFIETLRGPAKEDAVARDRFLNIMEGEAGRMNRLIGDLLSLSRVEGEGRVRPRDAINLVTIIQSVLNSLSPVGEEASVTFDLELSDAAVEMTGDADQLMQVFTNLIENAVKYGASGGKITVRLDPVGRDTALRAEGVRVHVIDYGPGIDAVHLPRLTERFYRADSHRSRALGGTGLGLAIVKHIVNRHRGRFRVESELGVGTQFTVILPIHQIAVQPESA